MRAKYQKLKEHFRQVLLLDGSPHRASLAFAIGVFIAFAPHLGLHTLSAVGLAWVLRLNLPIMLAGAFVNNPWTIFPIYGFCLGVGNYLLGNGFQCFPDGFSSAELLEFAKNSPLPFVVGTLSAGTAASVPAYFILRRILYLVHFKDKKDTIVTS